jgi:predicted metal-dependent enzyme (double-stranded beta helix superfamily)
MDVERTMEFILEQQAQFATEFEQVNAALMRSTERHDAIEELVSRMAQNQLSIQQAVVDIATAQERTNEILATLAERHIETEQAIRELARSQENTQETVNVLLKTVERHISNHS